MRLMKFFVLSLFAMGLTACGGDDSGLPSQGGGGETLPAIVSLQVTPATATVPVGLEQQYLAEALLDDGSVKDVTHNAALSWRSSNPAIATIDTNGLATGVSPGDVTITASGIANGVPIERSVSLTVSNAVVTELQVTPANSSVPAGFAKQFIATAYLSDGSTRDVTNNAALSWSSDALSIATISNATDTKGQATGVAPGDANITASGTANGTSFSATATLTVTNATVTSLQVTPFNRAVPIGLSRPFTATAILADGSSLDVTNDPALSWSSSDPSIATITSTGTSGKGVAIGVAAGITDITASGTANGKSFSATQQLTVTNATVTSLQITPVTANVPAGLTQQFTATAILSDNNTLDVTNDAALSWSSSDPGIATISSTVFRSKGLATGVAEGSTTITASGKANGVPFSGSAELTVTDAVVKYLLRITTTDPLLYPGKTINLVALASMSDGSVRDITDTASWRSSDTNIATVLGGAVQGVTSGNATITASAPSLGEGSLVSWTAIVSVVQPKAIVGTSGAFAAIKADGDVVTWGDPASGGDSSPVQDQLTNVQSIGVSSIAFAAIKADGSVVTWGLHSDSSPVQDQLTNVQSITGSDSAFAALKADGSVVTWGDSDAGSDSSAVQDQLTNVQSITATATAFAALKTDGTVVTWGPALSDGNLNGSDSSAVQPELTNMQNISASRRAFAALKADGTVVTWGSPKFGGDSSPVQSELTNVQSIIGNNGAFAALKADGTVVTWGDPEFGSDSSSVQSQLTNVQSISATGQAFAALKADGSVVTWGSGDASDSSSVQSELTNVQSITGISGAFAAIKTDGTVVTWGNLSQGGDSSSVQPLTNVQSISGTDTAFAAIKADGIVVTWGDPDEGGNSSDVDWSLSAN